MSYIFPKIYPKVFQQTCIFARYGRYQNVVEGKKKLWKIYFEDIKQALRLSRVSSEEKHFVKHSYGMKSWF